MRRKNMLKALVAGLGVSALLVKAVLVAPPPAHADTHLDRIQSALAGEGLIETGRTNLTSDGTYRAARYATLSCPEAMIVMPLLRNGEFKGLIDAPRFPIAYIIGGESYDSLPIVRLWIETLLARIGLSASSQPPVAVVADPKCLPDPAQLLS